MATALQLHPHILEKIKKENNHFEGLKHAIKAWLSGKSSLPPTWATLLKTLRSIEIEDLADEICKKLFSEAQVRFSCVLT